MIQDILPYRFKNTYDPSAVPTAEDLVIAFNDDETTIMLRVDSDKGSFTYPRVADFNASGIEVSNELTYLFSVDNERFFLASQNADDEITECPAGFSYMSFRDIRARDFAPKHYVFVAFTAMQLARWYKNTTFCGRCGARNENDKEERARICPKCGNKRYPRINPAVIIGVLDKVGNKIVLTKYRTGFAHNALVAGFTEIGETLEETVAREVMEEVGLKVKNVRYYKSQPWGVASDILAGFFCDVDGDTAISMDESELKYAEWVSPEDILLQPTDYSLTNEMMGLFKEKGYEGTVKQL